VLKRRALTRAVRAWRPQPFVAWAIGSAGAYAIHVAAPQLSEAIAGLVLGGVACALIEAFSPRTAEQPAPDLAA
jgi:cytosine permease